MTRKALSAACRNSWQKLEKAGFGLATGEIIALPLEVEKLKVLLLLILCLSCSHDNGGWDGTEDKDEDSQSYDERMTQRTAVKWLL